MKRFLLVLFVSCALAAPALAAPAPITTPGGCPTTGCLESAGKLGIPDLSAKDVAKNAVDILSLLAGALSVIFLVVGGIKYATSEGNATKLAGAKSTIMYAIIGLIISLLAPQIASFAIAKGPQL